MTSSEVRAARRRLDAWAMTSGRTLPWRDRPSRYHLAVAEVLLQKTKANDAEPVWRRLTRRYPDPAAILRARDASLFHLVKGLGLGRQRVGRLRTVTSWLLADDGDLKGIGAYGRGVMSLALGEIPPEAPVDGNIARIVTRLLALSFQRGEPRKKAEVRRGAAQFLGTRTTPERRLRTVYALVDLGAKVCRPRRPMCPVCPLSASCRSSMSRTDSPNARPTGGGTASETNRNWSDSVPSSS